MKFLKEKLNLRIYQQTILNTALTKNTLCVIPTGLGKTFIALALIGLLLKEKKALFLAPTKPLVNQHLNTFKEFFDAEENEMISVDGTVLPKKRKEIYTSSKIIFATPQTIENDLIAKRINPDEFSIIVFDEAHRASGEYAYVFIAKKFQDSRILALTASPGYEIEKINEIKSNLFIEKIEKRNREDEDVRDYVKKIDISYNFIELPKQMKAIKKHLEMAMKDKLNQLQELEFVETTNISYFNKKSLLKLQTKLRAELDEGSFDVMRGLSICAELIKINHAKGLVESESLNAVLDYFKSIWDQSKITKTKAVKNLVQNFHFRVAYKIVLDLVEDNIEHPKINELKKIIKKELKKNPY